MAGGANLFHLMHLEEPLVPVVGAAVVAVGLTGFGLAVRASVGNVEKHLVPEKGISLLNLATSFVSYFRNLLDTIVGHGSEKYVPIVGGIFIFILFSNYTGLFPGWLPPTDQLNTNAAMALFVFFFYNGLGLKEHGFHYFKQFTGGLPPAGYSFGLTIVLSLIAGLVFVIETVGHIFRPASLSLRLWGNMNGDHILLSTVFDLAPWGVPMLALGLGLFVGLIQALVFSLLTTVYIKLAVSHDH